MNPIKQKYIERAEYHQLHEVSMSVKNMIVKIKTPDVPVMYMPHHWWVTVCNSQGQPMFTSETYKTKQAAEKAVAVLKKHGLKFSLRYE